MLQARTLPWGLYVFAIFICWENCLLLSFYRTPILHPDWIFKWTHHGRDFYRNCAAAHQAAEEIIRRRRKTLQDKVLAWKHSRHFATQPLVSPAKWRLRTAVRKVEINPILTAFTTQIWVVLLIGWSKFSANQRHCLDRVVTRHQYGISAHVSQTSFRGEISDSIAKCRRFSQAMTRYQQ